MRNLFPEFNTPSPKGFNRLWTEAVFVFDTNVLLSLYRLPEKARKDLLSIFFKLKTKIWIPHYVAMEYYRKRIEVIYDQERAYKNILQIFEENEKGVLNQLRGFKHPFIDGEAISKTFSSNCCDIRKEIEKKRKKHPDWHKKDIVENKLNKIFKNKIGSAYDQKRLDEIYSLGKNRYDKDIPPGYKDKDNDNSDKTNTRKFGDLIIWFQIMDKAKELKKPIIFVTDEQKEDWWWKISDHTLGPRYELKKEIKEYASVGFHMYKTDKFMKFAGEFLRITYSKGSIEDVKKLTDEAQKKQGAKSLDASVTVSVSDVVGVSEAIKIEDSNIGGSESNVGSENPNIESK